MRAGDEVRLKFPSGEVCTRGWLDSHPLDRVRLLRHSAGRVVCQCRTPGVEMAVRLRDEEPHLANLPGRGHHHAPWCPSYTPDPRYDARLDYATDALAESAGACAVVVADTPSPGPPYRHLTPRAALEWLFDRAELTHWSPRMQGRRTPATARGALARAISGVSINGAPLDRNVAIVGASRPPYRPDYVIGAIERVVRGAHSPGLVLAGDPVPIWLAREAWTPAIESVLGSASAPRVEGPVWVFGRLWYSDAHVHFRWLGMMPVTPEWLPLEHPLECELLARLVRLRRRFTRVVALDSAGDPRFPIALLVDTATPVELYSPTVSRFPAPVTLPDEGSQPLYTARDVSATVTKERDTVAATLSDRPP